MTLLARQGALSDIGLHRKTNEDSFVVAPPLFAVCDGMGGALAGEVASGLAAETLAAAVAAGRPLLAAAEAANAAVYARACGDEAHSGMGTTLTAVVLEGDVGHFVHIGDSRAYLLRGGELQQLSDDHSLVGEMVREGRLTEEEAASHPHRSILSRALGTEPTVRIDEFEVDLCTGDVLLLCSDGLSGVVSSEAIRKALGRRDPVDAARRLIAEARRQGGPDNITAVVLHLEAAPPAGHEGEDEITLSVPAEEAAVTVLDVVPGPGMPGADSAAADEAATAIMPAVTAPAPPHEPAAATTYEAATAIMPAVTVPGPGMPGADSAAADEAATAIMPAVTVPGPGMPGADSAAADEAATAIMPAVTVPAPPQEPAATTTDEAATAIMPAVAVPVSPLEAAGGAASAAAPALADTLSEEGPEDGALADTLSEEGPEDGALADTLSEEGPEDGALADTLSEEGPAGAVFAVPPPGGGPAADLSLTIPPAPVPPAPESPGAPPGAGRGQRRRFGCLVVVLVLLVGVGLAGAVTLSSVYYVGVDDGRLALYSGLPASVGPLHLHAVYRRSTVAYDSLTPAQRLLVDGRGLHGRGTALDLATVLGMRP